MWELLHLQLLLLRLQAAKPTAPESSKRRYYWSSRWCSWCPKAPYAKRWCDRIGGMLSKTKRVLSRRRCGGSKRSCAKRLLLRLLLLLLLWLSKPTAKCWGRLRRTKRIGRRSLLLRGGSKRCSATKRTRLRGRCRCSKGSERRSRSSGAEDSGSEHCNDECMICFLRPDPSPLFAFLVHQDSQLRGLEHLQGRACTLVAWGSPVRKIKDAFWAMVSITMPWAVADVERM